MSARLIVTIFIIEYSFFFFLSINIVNIFNIFVRRTTLVLKNPSSAARGCHPVGKSISLRDPSDRRHRRDPPISFRPVLLSLVKFNKPFVRRRCRIRRSFENRVVLFFFFGVYRAANSANRAFFARIANLSARTLFRGFPSRIVPYTRLHITNRLRSPVNAVRRRFNEYNHFYDTESPSKKCIYICNGVINNAFVLLRSRSSGLRSLVSDFFVTAAGPHQSITVIIYFCFIIRFRIVFDDSSPLPYSRRRSPSSVPTVAGLFSVR